MSRSTTPMAHRENRAVIDTRLTHDVHRRATSVLAVAPSDPTVLDDALTELRDFLVTMLHHHHRSEDDLLWPMILGAAPQLAAPLSELSREHDRLAAVLDELAAVPLDATTGRAALGRAGAAVRDLVHEHLDRDLVGSAEEVELVLHALPEQARQHVPALRAQARAALEAIHAATP